MDLKDVVRRVVTVFSPVPFFKPVGEEEGENTVAFENPWYTYHESQWQDSDNLMEGTRALLRTPERYIAKFVNEEADEKGGQKRYEQRLRNGVLFNGYERSNEGFTGLAFKKRPQLQNTVPASFRKHWERLSLDRAHGAEFLRECYASALAKGSGAINVDFMAQTGSNAAESEALGADRPYWEWMPIDTIINCDFAMIRGESKLSLFVTKKDQWVRPQGAFKGKTVRYYRVWYLVPGDSADADTCHWERWVRNIDANGKITYERLREGVIKGQRRIPIVPLALGRGKHPVYRAPVFWPLAEMNLRHFMTDVAYHWNLLMQGYGVGVRIGAEPDEDGETADIFTGPGGIVDVGVGGDYKIVAPPADAFVHQRQALRDDETRMGALGLSFLQPDMRMAETATAKELDMASQYATLEMSVRKLVDVVEECMGIHMDYLGEEVKEDDLGLDFAIDMTSRGLDPQLLAALSLLEEKKQLTLTTLLITVRDGKLPETLDIEKEMEDLLIEREAEFQRVKDMAAAKKPTPPAQNPVGKKNET